jgi:hypothetical protein
MLSKRVPTLGEGIACHQDPDSLHCKALKRVKSLGELKIKSLAIIFKINFYLFVFPWLQECFYIHGLLRIKFYF